MKFFEFILLSTLFSVRRIYCFFVWYIECKEVLFYSCSGKYCLLTDKNVSKVTVHPSWNSVVSKQANHSWRRPAQPVLKRPWWPGSASPVSPGAGTHSHFPSTMPRGWCRYDPGPNEGEEMLWCIDLALGMNAIAERLMLAHRREEGLLPPHDCTHHRPVKQLVSVIPLVQGRQDVVHAQSVPPSPSHLQSNEMSVCVCYVKKEY